MTDTVDNLSEDDFRTKNPRYRSDNFKTNTRRFAFLMEAAEELGVSAAQLSLTWLLHRGEDIIPIPGTRKPERVTENAQTADLVLSPAVVEKISRLAAPGLAQGETLLQGALWRPSLYGA